MWFMDKFSLSLFYPISFALEQTRAKAWISSKMLGFSQIVISTSFYPQFAKRSYQNEKLHISVDLPLSAPFIQ